VLQSAGLDEGTAGFVTALNTGIAAGDLDVTDSTLVRLIGRPVTPMVDVISRAVSA
jgi:NAD(P)H dehydrogenase (quinone)